MNGRAATGRRHIERARVRPGVGNELGDASDRHGRMHLHDVRHPRKAHDRCDIADEVVRKLLIERGIDGVHRADEQKRIAIRRRTNHRIGDDVGAAARLVFDDELLAEQFGKPLPENPRQDIGRAARRERHDPAHRSRRIGIRRDAWNGAGETKTGRRQSQELQGTRRTALARNLHRPLAIISAATS